MVLSISNSGESNDRSSGQKMARVANYFTKRTMLISIIFPTYTGHAKSCQSRSSVTLVATFQRWCRLVANRIYHKQHQAPPSSATASGTGRS